MPDKELKKYSYIKKPFARNGWYAFFTALMVLILTVLTLYMSVRMQGESTMLSGALGLSCLLFSGMGILFSWLSHKEEEKDQLFANIGLGLSLLILLFWIVLTIMGLLQEHI